MKRNTFKIIPLILAFTSISMFCDARKVPGYIITENSDTLYGKVRLRTFKLNTAVWLLNGIDLESFHSIVEFKTMDNKKYLIYKPDMIQGYGFTYDSVDYIFQSFKIESKSKHKNDGEIFKFLNLIYLGKFSLYRDIIRDNGFDSGQTYFYATPNNHDLPYIFHEYYIYNEVTGLIKVELTRDIKSYNELLKYCGLSTKYVETLPEIKDIHGLIKAIMQYDNWLNNSKAEANIE